MNELQRIPIGLIDEDADQPRSKAHLDDDIELLSETIEASGLLNPILLRPHPVIDGRYMVIDGARRLRAMRKLGNISDVPALIRQDEIVNDAPSRLAAQFFANEARRDLNRTDFLDTLKKLSEQGYKNVELAKKLGVSKSAISKHLAYVYEDDAIRLRNEGLLDKVTVYTVLKNLKVHSEPLFNKVVEHARATRKPIGHDDIARIVEHRENEPNEPVPAATPVNSAKVSATAGAVLEGLRALSKLAPPRHSAPPELDEYPDDFDDVDGCTVDDTRTAVYQIPGSLLLDWIQSGKAPEYLLVKLVATGNIPAAFEPFLLETNIGLPY
jgi:ParB family chromosome partitioning protein